MRRLLAGMLLSVLSALACPSLTTAGASDEALALLLIKKGILTQEEYEALKREIEGVVLPAPAMAARQPAAPPVDTESAALPVDRLRDEVRDELKRRDEGSVKIDAGAQIRVRGDFARNQNFTDFTFTPGASEGQALERIRPRASIELPASKVRLVTQGQWYGRRGGVDEREDLDLYQAYIEWNDILDSPVSIRAGRQELVYGSTFFLGANDFYNGLTWDGLKLTLAPGADFTVDAVGVTMATLNPGDPDIYLAGVYATWRAAEGHALEGYFFYNAGFYPFSHGEVTLPSDGHRWFTLGARVAGRAHGLDYELEPLVQWGSVPSPDGRGSDDVRAWGGHAELGYTFPLAWKPRLFGAYAWGSGDAKPFDGTYREFHGTVFNDHPVVGDMSVVADLSGVAVGETRASGVRVWVAGALLSPTADLSLSLDAHRFFASEVPDGFSRDLGIELNLVASYRLWEKLTMLVGVNRFLTGRFFRQAAGTRRDIDYAYVQATLEF